MAITVAFAAGGGTPFFFEKVFFRQINQCRQQGEVNQNIL